MASDFAIAQFRFLERLLLVHGHWCYRRIAAMVEHYPLCFKLFRELVPPVLFTSPLGHQQGF
jgi:hypothetical protein